MKGLKIVGGKTRKVTMRVKGVKRVKMATGKVRKIKMNLNKSRKGRGSFGLDEAINRAFGSTGQRSRVG